MSLRAVVSDWFYRLVAFCCEPVVLSDGDIEKRERLVQTYLIVFGLFLAYDNNIALQSLLMRCFMTFLWFALVYYSFLIRPLHRFARLFYQGLALGMAAVFSYAFVVYIAAFDARGSGYDYIMFTITTILVAYPLFV